MSIGLASFEQLVQMETLKGLGLAGLGLGALGAIETAEQIRSAFRRARARAANGDPQGASQDLQQTTAWIHAPGRPETEKATLLAEFATEWAYVRQAEAWSEQQRAQAAANRQATNQAIDRYSPTNVQNLYQQGGQFGARTDWFDRAVDGVKNAWRNVSDSVPGGNTTLAIVGLLAVGYASGGLAKLLR